MIIGQPALINKINGFGKRVRGLSRVTDDKTTPAYNAVIVEHPDRFKGLFLL